MTFIPNTTPTPNWLYNGEMRKMNETQLKVVMLVTRKTLGWFDPKTSERKSQDYISQKQFMDFTGKSNRAIATAIQSCIESGWIIGRDRKNNLCDKSEKRRRRKIWYQLGNIFINKLSSEDSSLDDDSSEHISKSSEQNDPNLVNNVHNTKVTLTKETIQKEISPQNLTPLAIMVKNIKSWKAKDKEYDQLIRDLELKGFSNVEEDLDKFFDYWTEPNKNGKKEKWELQQTFEFKRRLTTWLGKASEFRQK